MKISFLVFFCRLSLHKIIAFALLLCINIEPVASIWSCFKQLEGGEGLGIPAWCMDGRMGVLREKRRISTLEEEI